MPYIPQSEREYLTKQIVSLSARFQNVGQLAYALFTLLIYWVQRKKNPRFVDYALTFGVVCCVAFEFFRRVISRYEDKRMMEEGDVYFVWEETTED